MTDITNLGSKKAARLAQPFLIKMSFEDPDEIGRFMDTSRKGPVIYREDLSKP